MYPIKAKLTPPACMHASHIDTTDGECFCIHGWICGSTEVWWAQMCGWEGGFMASGMGTLEVGTSELIYRVVGEYACFTVYMPSANVLA